MTITRIYVPKLFVSTASAARANGEAAHRIAVNEDYLRVFGVEAVDETGVGGLVRELTDRRITARGASLCLHFASTAVDG